MGEHVVYVAVGSNIDPERNIPEALRRLAENVTVGATSRFYRTEPLGRPGQPPFLNGVVRVRTALDAEILKFKVLRGIEKALGRERTADTYAPRTIDLDILLFDTAMIERPGLRIPDPDIPHIGRTRNIV
jgi:2-amino-4-hydroxy-6-hydroxymethyldihydropteridine diphosphokinase